MNPITLSLKLLGRQGQSMPLVMLLAGLAVATAALSAVSLFTDRVGRAMERQASEALAADLIVAGRERVPVEFVDQARSMGLETAELVLVSTVIFAGDESNLIDVKAATDGYPLRGRLQVSPELGADDREVEQGPRPGEAWLEPRAVRTLDLELPATVELGRRTLDASQVLTWEPDRGGSRFMLAPRMLVHFDDLMAADLLGPGSRARFRLLIAGSERSVAEFGSWVSDRLDDNQALITVADAEDQTGQALTQARRFLGIAALTAVILAAVAILLTALRYQRSQRDLIALLKCFGASTTQVGLAMVLVLAWLVLIAVAVGGAAGWLAQESIVRALAEAPVGELPPARLLPLLGSAVFTVLLAAGFALPPLMSLRRVPPMRILNRAMDRMRTPWLLSWGLAIAGALAIPVLQLGDLRLAVIVLGACLVLALALALTGWLAMLGTRTLATRAGPSWRFGLAGLQRRRAGGILQITALGLALMALLLLLVVRGELMSQWQSSLPPDTPDHFLVNIQPDQVEAVGERLTSIGARNLQIRPMANANLLRVSGQRPPDDRMAGQVNISWIDELPPANEIVAGEFFAPGATGEVSLAEMWAERLGVELGDELTFESGALEFSARVTSIRRVDWNSFNVNFFILLTPDAGKVLPHQHIASFYLADGDGSVLRPLNREFPNISILDIGALIQRVQEIIDQVSNAAQVVFFFTLIAGLVVLLAAIEATRDERRHESALIRTLGADNGLVRRGILVEYGVMALIAGLLATGGAAVTGWLMARELFNFAYQPTPILFALGFVAAFILVLGSGWIGNRSVLATPPVRILRAG